MTPTDVTTLLAEVERGDPAAADRLLPIVYEELRALASRFMSNERAGHTLQTTALVHEAYMRLVGAAGEPFAGREHFFRAAATAMRRVLVDHARARRGPRRGGARLRVPLESDALAVAAADTGILDLDEALTQLAELDAALARMVELRYFAGLTIDEVAALTGASPTTVKREWQFAKAWLRQALQDEDRIA